MGKAIVLSVVGCSEICDNKLFPRREIENAEIHNARLLFLQSPTEMGNELSCVLSTDFTGTKS